jgi:hypothetical protein
LKVSGDCQAVLVRCEWLEATLGGNLLLVEHDGYYGRIVTWLWRYWLGRHTFGPRRFQIVEEVAMLARGSGRVFHIAAGNSSIMVEEYRLEMAWSGRLYIVEWTQQYSMLFRYLWDDIRDGLASSTSRWGIS